MMMKIVGLSPSLSLSQLIPVNPFFSLSFLGFGENFKFYIMADLFQLNSELICDFHGLVGDIIQIRIQAGLLWSYLYVSDRGYCMEPIL